jgi:hypothetical protein
MNNKATSPMLVFFQQALFILLLPFALLTMSCDSEKSDPVAVIEVLSSTINGANSSEANLDVPINVTIVLVFSNALDPIAFQSAFSIVSDSSPVDYTLAFSNADSKVTASMTLDYTTNYTVNLAAIGIGMRGQKLKNPKSFSFKTAEDDVVRTMQPCTNVGNCLRSVALEGSQGLGNFQFYSNYPIYEVNAEWENLTDAVIVVHGASHNPENYYTYMTNTFESVSVGESTILIAPFFRNTSTGSSDDFYWPNTNWRRGSPSSNSNKISSFEVLDLLIDQLTNSERFPRLKKIIITGHSSGAAFTHVYAASNESETKHTSIEFEYVVANSQFLYYPNGQRYNEENNQLYTPTGCSAYDLWPLGYNAIPPYLSGVSASTFNSQFTSRKITYLLGNGSQSDPTLNTVDCENTLQGSSRFNRGDNMFKYMELSYSGMHNHQKVIVNGIGHDGQGMYQSNEFKTLLPQLLQ